MCPAIAETWTQTSRTDFEANTTTHVELSNIQGSATIDKDPYIIDTFEAGVNWTSTGSSLVTSTTDCMQGAAAMRFYNLAHFDQANSGAISVDISQYATVSFWGKEVEPNSAEPLDYTRNYLRDTANLWNGNQVLGSTWARHQLALGTSTGTALLYRCQAHYSYSTANEIFLDDVKLEKDDYVLSGSMTSTGIAGASWDTLHCTATTPGGSGFSVNVEGYNGSAWLDLGTYADGADLSGIAGATYNSIRLVGNFTSTDGSATAQLDNWSVDYTVPEPATMVLLMLGLPLALRRRRK